MRLPCVVDAGREITSPLSSIDFEFLRGAIAGLPDVESAFPNRVALYIVAAPAQWTDVGEGKTHGQWAQRGA